MILQSEAKACTIRVSKGGVRVCRICLPAADKFDQPLGWLPQLRRGLVRDKVILLQPDPVQVSDRTLDCRAQSVSPAGRL
jgi:hypothetical protein